VDAENISLEEVLDAIAEKEKQAVLFFAQP
jgi:hypothetical protein